MWSAVKGAAKCRSRTAILSDRGGALFGGCVEDVHAIEIHAGIEPLAHERALSRPQLADHDGVFEPRVHDDLVAERLDDVRHEREARPFRTRAGADAVKVLGANPYDHGGAGRESRGAAKLRRHGQRKSRSVERPRSADA